MNLFLSTHKLSARREDHLTEFFAAALDSSIPLRERYLKRVLPDPTQFGFPADVRIENVSTQVSYPQGRPDMVLKLSDGQEIACEHKLDALETEGTVDDQRPQLQRYLSSSAAAVLYVRSSPKSPDSDVLSHQKYIHPTERRKGEHFLWRDFYAILAPSESPVQEWLKAGFEHLGFTPPNSTLGDLNDPDPDIQRANRENFKKLWGPTRSCATGLGWKKIEGGGIVELYLSHNPSSLASMIFISPSKAERFLVRMTPADGDAQALAGILERASQEARLSLDVSVSARQSTTDKIPVVDCTTSLYMLLGDQELAVADIEQRLLSIVQPLLVAIQKP